MSNDLDKVRGNLKRLQRHYELAVRTYDEIALADLSHILRIWSEMKSDLVRIIPSLSSSREFRAGYPTKHVRRILAGHEFVLSYLPEGTITFASKGDLIQLPQIWGTTPGTLATTVKVNDDHSVEMKQFVAVRTKLVEEQVNSLSKWDTKCFGYQAWFSTEAVRVGTSKVGGNGMFESISRDELIKCVANKYGGSHSGLVTDERGKASKFDSTVAYLMEFHWGGLPLPYFVLLKTAQDILDFVGRRCHDDI